jgi:hypothetical protein
MMPFSTDLSVTSFFFELNFVFCGIIINQLLSQVNNKQLLNNNPMMFENVMRNFNRRVVKCIDEGGQHFQHLL